MSRSKLCVSAIQCQSSQTAVDGQRKSLSRADRSPLTFLSSLEKLQRVDVRARELTAAILPEAEMAPTVRLDSRSAFLNDMVPAREATSELFEEK